MHATTRTHIPLPTRWKLARFDRMLRKHADTMAGWFGQAQTEAMRAEMLGEYRRLLPRVPYVGGRRNRYTPALEMSARALAIHRVFLRHGGTVEQAGQILHDWAKAMFGAVPGPLRGPMLAPKRARAEKQARWTQQSRYPGDWYNEIVEGDGRTFDWGIDITECGVVKFLHAEGADELTPYICDLDYASFEGTGVELIRTKTLAWGCDRCDFRFKTPGETTAPWPPVFAERHCGPATCRRGGCGRASGGSATCRPGPAPRRCGRRSGPTAGPPWGRTGRGSRSPARRRGRASS